jgi:4'-phosphopantetheinyl transferase
MTASEHWPPGPECPGPIRDGCHVWRIRLGAGTAAGWPSATQTAGPGGGRALDSWGRPQPGVCGNAMRDILSRYVGRAPHTLLFGTGRHGKPYLRGPGSPKFNLSHTDGWALLAVCDTDVGVDVERIRTDLDPVALAERFFSRREVVAVRSGGPGVFFRYWVCKESYAKALGQGLRNGIPELALTLPANGPARGPIEMTGSWRLYELAPDPDCPAALVTGARDSGPMVVTQWTWTPSGAPASLEGAPCPDYLPARTSLSPA